MNRMPVIAIPNSEGKRAVGNLQRAVQWLLKSNGSFREANTRRVRLLAGLLLTLNLLVALAFVTSFLISRGQNQLANPALPVAGGALLLLGLAYGLNRTGRYTSAAWLTISVAAVGAWASAITNREGPLADPFLLAFVIISVLLASILLSPRETSVLAMIHIACIILFFPERTTTVIFTTFMFGLILVASSITRSDLAQISRQARELALAYDSTLEGWTHALEMRDRETEGHTQRVTETVMQLAQRIGISAAELVHVRRGALLHDIGKMGVPDSILLKPGPLTEEEWAVMRKHPQHAYDLLSPIAYLRLSLDIPYCHHEKWDGTGYPCGLRGEQIPLAARIFAVVDVWDALRSCRPYRLAWPEEKVREHIRTGAGTHFDPHVVEAFLRMIEQKCANNTS